MSESLWRYSNLAPTTPEGWWNARDEWVAEVLQALKLADQASKRSERLVEDCEEWRKKYDELHAKYLALTAPKLSASAKKVWDLIKDLPEIPTYDWIEFKSEDKKGRKLSRPTIKKAMDELAEKQLISHRRTKLKLNQRKTKAKPSRKL
jgi:hypothetical protein